MFAARSILISTLLLMGASAFSASPSLSVGQYPKTIYLGDSVSLTIVLHDFDNTQAQPQFANHGASTSITFLGSQDSTSRYESWINGKRISRTNSDRHFSYRIIPTQAGKFTTGEISIACGSTVLTAPECAFNVVGPQSSPDLFCSLGCNYKSVLVDSSFKVVFTLSVRALPPPFSETEPLLTDKPINITAAYLDFAETPGLSVPSVDDALGPYISARSGKATFTINKYIVQDFFTAYARKFHFDAAVSNLNGTNYWTYTLPVEYTATEIGEYTFGPVYVKGEIPVLLDDRGTYRPQQIFVCSQALTVNVMPPPEEGRPAWYVGAIGSSMDIKAALDAEHCKVGDPLALTLDITGDINLRSLSPPELSFQFGKQEDFKIYDDNVETVSIPGGKQFKYRIRPLHAGTFEFPSVKAAFFNAKQGEYFTVASEPMPLQVEATTQITAISDDADSENKSIDNTVPDGIIMNREDRQPRSFSLLGKHSLAILLGAPLGLLLLASATKFIVVKTLKLLSSTRHSRNASGAFRDLRNAASAAKNGDTEAGQNALRAARTCIASLLGNDAASVTEPDIVSGLSARGVSAQDAEAAGHFFADLENAVYSGNSGGPDLAEKISTLADAVAKAKTQLRPARRSRVPGTSSLLLIAAVSALAAIPSKSLAIGNSDFEWDRANRIMFSAKTEADFLNAAKDYFGIVTNGVSSGPLYYNLGTALILAGKPQAAIESLKEAEIYLGTAREVADNWKAANAKITNSNGEVPVSRTFLCWHYGLDLAARTDIAVFCWVVFCLFATLLVFIPKSPASTPVKFLKRISLAFLWIAAVGTLFYGSTALLYYRHKNASFHSLPGVELSLQPPAADSAAEAAQ